MTLRLSCLASAGCALVFVFVACGGATDTRSTNGGALGTDAGSGGSSAGGSTSGGAGSKNGGASNGGSGTGGASNGGASAGGQGGQSTGGIPSVGGSSGAPGTGGSAGSAGGSLDTGGAPNAGGAQIDGGPCNACLPNYDLHWGQDGGLVAYVETSRLGPCAAYSHERTPTVTDPPSLICNATISMCPGSPLAQIIEIMGTAAFTTALTNHTLYGSDPRPVDGQVFRIGIGNDFIDVGPNCESDPTSCPTMPEPVARLVKLLRDLDATMLAQEPCKTVFGN